MQNHQTASDSLHPPVLHMRGSTFTGGESRGFFVENMSEPTIEFRTLIKIELPDGESFEAPISDEIEIEMDPLAYVAKTKGVERWKLVAWLIHHQRRGLCSGLTRSGSHCLCGAVTSYPKLIDFKDGQDNRCRLHQISSSQTPEAGTPGNQPA